MTQTVTTANSVYEIDRIGKFIRRVSGVNEPTECFTPNGEWKRYHELREYTDARGDVTLFVTWLTGAPHAVSQTSPIIRREATST